MRRGASVGLLVTLAIAAGSASADSLGGPERCRVARYKAAAKYRQCQTNALGRDVNPATLVIGGMSGTYQRVAARCRAKYAATWPRLQAAFPGVARCSGPRFVDNGDGTLFDALTGLTWELKVDDGSVHDPDATWSWSLTGTLSDGTAFSSLLAVLNSTHFGGAVDWRLPSMDELQTILSPENPCTTCIDAAFGVSSPFPTWTSTEDPDLVDLVREVSFGDGTLNNGGKMGFLPVRAVRGGL
jgi:hypothetical protein